MKIRQLILICFTTCILLAFGSVESAQAQDVNWRGWTFDYQVSGDYDGVSLTDVYYDGTKILQKASLPVMRVFYDNNACGPYADRLGGTLQRVEWAGNATIVNREITVNGERWREIGIQDKIGAYIMYQVWYLSENGVIDAHIFAKGLQCNVTHLHYPQWRMDFDLAGGGNDQVRRYTGSSWQTMTTEFRAGADTASGHQWQIRDTVTGDKVDVEFGTSIWNVPGQVIPRTSYANNDVQVRRYRSSEDTGWTYGANSNVPYDNNENINSQDIVFWYDGYLRHTAAEGPTLWHSTGARFVVDLNNGPTPTPTNTSPPPTVTNTPLPGANTPLLNTNFGSGTNGFSYQDNTFRGTNQGAYVSGSRIGSGAYNNSAGLRVLLGAIDNNDINNMSGGWRANFNVPSTAPVTLSFRYNLTQASEYENDEYGQVMASVDGTLYGSGGNDYIQQINGDGNGGSDRSTGWQTYSVNLGTLSAGNHSLIIGGFSNKKTYNDELTTVLFDDVLVTADLSQVPTSTPTPTNTPTATSTPTNTPTDTPTSTPTNTPIPPPTNTPLPNNELPIVANPGEQTTTIGESINLSLTASDPDEDELSYSAENLPSGLTIDSGTGQISGTPDTVATYNTIITVSDGTDSVTTSFIWNIIDPPPPVEDSIIRAGSATVDTGASTSVDITIESGAVEVGAVTIDLTYDSTLITVTDCQGVDFQGACNIDTAGLVLITGANPNGLAGNSTLATLSIVGNASGVSNLNISSVSTFSEPTGNSIGYVPVNGQVTVNAIAPTPTPTPPPPIAGCGPLQQEAEDGTLSGAFIVGADTSASNGEFAYTLGSVSNVWDGPDGVNKISFCATVSEDGTYRIQAVTAADGLTADSFYVQVDDEPVTGYLWDTPQATSFTTGYVGDRNGTNPVEIPLAAGDHTVTFFLRESGTKLDKFALELIETVEPPADSCAGLVREAEDGILSGDFAVVSDGAASAGAYIQVPEGNGTEWNGPNGSRKADYCFTVDQAGTYRIEGLVAGADDLSDSFYVRVNNAPPTALLWDTATTDTFVVDNVSDRNGANPVLLTLDPGIHYVTIYAREDGSKLDKLTLALDGAVEPPSLTCTGLSREAEDGALSGGFIVANDTNANGGQYIHVPNGAGNEWSGPNAQRKADFCFTVDQADTYVIKATVYGDNDLDDSFYVQVDDAPASGYLWDTPRDGVYVEDYVSDRNNVDPVTVALTAGEHRVSVYLREDGTRLDSIELELATNVALQAALNGEAAGSAMAMGIYGTILLEQNSPAATVNRDAIDFTQFSITLVDATTVGQQYARTIDLSTNGTYRLDNMPVGNYLLTLNVPDGFDSMMPAQLPVTLGSEQLQRVSPDVLKQSNQIFLFLPLFSE